MLEWPRFADGTRAIAEAVAATPMRTRSSVAADSVRALQELGLGEASSRFRPAAARALELLEGQELPGVAAIPEG